MAPDPTTQPTQQSAPAGATQNTGSTTTGTTTTDRESQIPVQRETREGSRESSMERGTGMEMTHPFSANPFTMMRAMMDDMDRVFGRTGLGFGGLADALLGTRRRSLMRPTTQEALWLPAIDISKRNDQLVVHAELPGLSAKDINIEVDNGALVISGERKQEATDAYHSERIYGSFYRAIPLPENVDPNQINATFQNGVLEVTMPQPKVEQERRKKIEVRG
jgi:HSP20 family protein